MKVTSGTSPEAMLRAAAAKSANLEQSGAGNSEMARQTGFSEALARASAQKAQPDQENEISQMASRATASAGSGDTTKLRELSREFEAIFVNQMLKAMRKSVLKSGLLDGGTGEEIFTDMLDSEYSKSMASTGGFGLAETIYRQLSRQSESASPQNNGDGSQDPASTQAGPVESNDKSKKSGSSQS